ncbi:glycoside hydrolase family 38 C-terminal domain-containing protein [Bacillus sp. FJAT-27225]|uniref:glycoside hydrolase family 38 N-terminal domain-containing protein n=1 Tax=Bacillus sp. FJAT-27225 TaxID=1743144 RepID=UPI000981B681|nr:alpha-mannosidase [Bacillus sp. FJAT-27225]
MKKLHLVCNAHLDPAWLWELEEGAGEALSTFRIAADFCEKFDGFIFNHNEVLLYKWVETFDPVLFKRIQKLVAEGKWHIMGGWYLQPDCNLPSGESFIRQILFGRNYFAEKFGQKPTTAINFDSFGHTRGLVQILNKSGFDSYIVCRPDQQDCPLPGDDFVWVGYDGSEVLGHRAFNAYLSGRGKAHEKVTKWMELHREKEVGLVLWGIGNHGGGPSKIDLNNLQELKEKTKDFEVLHSTPEAYFAELKGNQEIEKHEGDLNPWAPGCYTSQIRIKQKHRQLENEIYSLEKMASAAALQQLATYPQESINAAIEDLMIAQFHDILAGTSIQAVEENSIRMMDHGLEILARERLKLFFALTSGQKQAGEGEIPIFVYNPHPYAVNMIIECEFQLPKSSKGHFALPVVYSNGERIPSQVEEEESSLYIDWRKKVSFTAELKPAQLNRFDCTVELIPSKPEPSLTEKDGKIHFVTDDLEVVINCQTGYVDQYRIDGKDYLKPNAFMPIVVNDNEDAWGSHVKSFPDKIGEFKLMDSEKATRVSGVTEKLPAVRIIEDGEVRSIIEVLFEYNDSQICQRYHLPKRGTEIEVELTAHWLEKDKMLKLSVPTVFSSNKYIGQVAFGREELPQNHKEAVAQKWSAVVSENEQLAFSCINDGTYGSDEKDGEIRLSLLRSAGYSALLGGEKASVIPQDRFSKRMDQGERSFRFWFNGSSMDKRLENIDREAHIHNEKPYALTYFPSGEGELPLSLLEIDDPSIQLSAFKKAEKTDDYLIRLFEPTGKGRTFSIHLPLVNISVELSMKGFEIKTLLLDVKNKKVVDSTLMEE